jgi:hypothetical protein
LSLGVFFCFGGDSLFAVGRAAVLTSYICLMKPMTQASLNQKIGKLPLVQHLSEVIESEDNNAAK